MIAARVLLALLALIGSGVARADNVLTYHKNNRRQGAYIEPTLTQTAAATMRLDPGFHASVSGQVYAQPLFWHPAGGPAEVIVVTENNQASALNSATGATIWSTQLPPSAPLSTLGCGDVNPEGIHGTPAIDPATATLYLDALELVNGAPTHMIYGLSLSTGAIRSGWPLNVDAAMAAAGASFTSRTQGDRGGAMIYKGNLYIVYGGRAGDCWPYYGTVIQVDPTTRTLVASWQTRVLGGGIWAQGGIAADGTSLFITTGNTFNAGTWSDGEAILRLRPGLAHSASTADFFAPSNWPALDQYDQDLGGTEAIPLDIYNSAGHVVSRVIAFGKDGNAYLADRGNLGGIGGQVASTAVSGATIITAPAIYETTLGTKIAFTNFAALAPCSGNALTMLNVAPGGSSPISLAWCAPLNGRGSPIVTTTDGVNDPIVWVAGAEGDNLLHGFNASTGAALYSGSTAMSGLHRFQTLIESEGRIYVAGDGNVYAFTYSPD